jgi:hypothetical protein
MDDPEPTTELKIAIFKKITMKIEIWKHFTRSLILAECVIIIPSVMYVYSVGLTPSLSKRYTRCNSANMVH